MIRPHHITFTGVDERTDVTKMYEISCNFPTVEWGILVSNNSGKEGYNRYPNYAFVENLSKMMVRMDMNFSIHLCGKWPKRFTDNKHYDFWPAKNIANTFQLNQRFDDYDVNGLLERFKYHHRLSKLTPIIQYRSVNEFEVLSTAFGDDVPARYLYDASGGRGLDIDMKNLPQPREYEIGFAGGINPDNVLEKLNDANWKGNYFIDMETGVRTDDWFDLDKVYSVLEQVYV